MSDEQIVKYCAPTLAGIKTGNLFSCKDASVAAVRALNRRLVPKGICTLAKKRGGTRTLVYVFRPAYLALDLRDARAAALLRARGYPFGEMRRCVAELMRRIENDAAFPHEVGLFLGYPPEDVRAFIDGRDAYKCVGCWKVYGDEDTARRAFGQYKRCTREYRRRWESGYSLDTLAVCQNECPAFW